MVQGWLARKKYQFEAITSLTMLEPSEKRAYCILLTIVMSTYSWLANEQVLDSTSDVVLLLLLLMTMYTLTVYLPPHLRQLVAFISGY